MSLARWIWSLWKLELTARRVTLGKPGPHFFRQELLQTSRCRQSFGDSDSYIQLRQNSLQSFVRKRAWHLFPLHAVVFVELDGCADGEVGEGVVDVEADFGDEVDFF